MEGGTVTQFVTIKMAKSNFFDRAKVQGAVDRASVRVLSRQGAFIRTAARSSLKYKKRPSAPGEPPVVHRTMSRTKTNKQGVAKQQTVSPLREFVFFSYDQASRSVVVGPALLNGRSGARTLQALEYGGPSTIRDSKGREKPVIVRARPFMGPALSKAMADLARKWQGQVKG